MMPSGPPQIISGPSHNIASLVPSFRILIRFSFNSLAFARSFSLNLIRILNFESQVFAQLFEDPEIIWGGPEVHHLLYYTKIILVYDEYYYTSMLE